MDKLQFRVRPSSKKSPQDLSLVEYQSKGSPEDTSLRALNNKVENLEQSVVSILDLFKREREVGNSGAVEVQRRLDKLDYRMGQAESQIRQMREARQIKATRETAQFIDSNPSRNQLALLKHTMAQQRQSNRELATHYSAMIDQISAKQIRLEQELRELIEQQSLNTDLKISGQSDELMSLSSLKQRKIDQQYEMLKGTIADAEKKIYEDMNRKIKTEASIRDFVAERITELRDEFTKEQKGILVLEARFVRESKQSIESLFSLMTTAKREWAEQLSETQRLTAANAKRLSVSIDIVREQFGEALLQMSRQQAEEVDALRTVMKGKLDEIRQRLDDVAAEKGKIDKGEGEVEERQTKDRVQELEREMNKWKVMTEEKNLNVFKEISNTLKSMKQEWRKEQEDMATEVSSIGDYVTNAKKSLPAELRKTVQTVVTIFNGEFDVLAEELDLLTEMIALAKKETEEHVQEQVYKLKTEIIQQTSVLVGQKAKQTNIYVDKLGLKTEEGLKAALSRESKYLNDLFSQKYGNLERQLGEVVTAMKKSSLSTAAQLEDFSLKLKTFNENYKDYLQEQRKEDLRNRIQLEEVMRQNAASLVELAYKKSAFLVEGIKKSFEAELANEKDAAEKRMQGNQQDVENIKQDLQKMKQEMHSVTLDVNKVAEDIKKVTEGMKKVVEDVSEEKKSINKTKQEMLHELGECSQQCASRCAVSEQQIQKLREKMRQLQEGLLSQQQREGQTKLQTDQQQKSRLDIICSDLNHKIESNRLALEKRLENLKGGAKEGQDTDETIKRLHDSLVKVEALVFSEQAKNKALLDRLTEDLASLSENLSQLAAEFNEEE